MAANKLAIVPKEKMQKIDVGNISNSENNVFGVQEKAEWNGVSVAKFFFCWFELFPRQNCHFFPSLHRVR